MLKVLNCYVLSDKLNDNFIAEFQTISKTVS